MFRAFDQQTERLVAIKLFTHDLAPERVHQLVAEFERLIDANLAHPAIAAPIAAGMHDNRAYLATEYVSADSLDVAIRQYGAAPPADALRVAAQLAGALDFAAVVHVAHGALHPRDVLLSSEEIRMTGLGIAKAFERIQIAAPVRRPYTPPEGIAGADWDRRADVFSLAALMHELLWGRRVSAIGAQAGASLTQIPGGDLVALREVFTRGLAERPADRFETALEFAQALTLAFPDAVHAAPTPAAAASAPARQPVDAAPDARLPLGEPAPASRPVSARQDVRSDAPLPVRIDTAPVPVDPARPADAAEARLPPSLPPPSVTPSLASGARDIEPADFELREAERARYQDVETAHAVAHAAPDETASAGPAEPVLVSSAAYADAPVSAYERSRSALWPLALALLVGLAIGFAGGYGVGNHDRSGGAQTVAAVQPSADSPSAADRSAADATPRDQTPAPAAETPQKPDTAPPAASAPSASTARTAEALAAPQKSDVEAPSAGVTKSEAGGAKSAAADAPSAGRLLVRSTPAGARVFVDGRDQGRTPVAVRELAHGEHRVRVVRDGYIAEDRRVTISAARPSQSLTVPLSSASRLAQAPTSRVPMPSTPGTTGRFVGALAVDSRPNGAKVFIDGKLAGVTPLQLAGLDAGEHVVRLERDGYRRWSSSVRVVASEQNRVTASLEK